MPEAIEDPELLYDETEGDENPEFKDERPRVQAPVAISGGPVNGNVDEVTGAAPPPGPVVAAPAVASAPPAPPMVRGVMAPTPYDRVSSVTIPTAQPRVQPPGGLNQIFGSMPIQQAEKAISTALRYQGVRQYQNALSQGKTPAEAMMAAAPLIFGGKQPNASMMRATQPPKPRTAHIANRLYVEGQDGNWTPATPEIAPKPQVFRPDSFDMNEFNSIQKNMRDIETSISKGDLNEDELTAARKRLLGLQARANGIRDRNRSPSPAQPASVSTPAPRAASQPPHKDGEIVVQKSTGKRFRVTNGVPVPIN